MRRNDSTTLVYANLELLGQLASLSMWSVTANSIYASLKNVLRAVDRRAAKKYFNYLRLFLEAMDCMPYRRTTLVRQLM